MMKISFVIIAIITPMMISFFYMILKLAIVDPYSYSKTLIDSIKP